MRRDTNDISHRIIWNKHNPYDRIEKGQYKDVIHHKDGNYENNDISNLQKMTHGEHVSLHNKGNNYFLGKKHSEETKRKIREANEGKLFGNKYALGNKSMTGKKHMEETKKKISLAIKKMVRGSDGKYYKRAEV